MAFPATRHPEHIKEAVKRAALAGVGQKTLWKRLVAGELEDGLGPYEMPFETVKAYHRQAKRHQRANGLTDRAKQPIPDALDSIAREIISELDQALIKNRKARTRDLDELAKIADIAKKLAPLAKPAGGRGRTESTPAKPADPLEAALRKAKSP